MTIRTKKTVNDGIVERETDSSGNCFIRYEPGNGTSYEIVFVTIDFSFLESRSSLVILYNFVRKPSMIVPHSFGLLHYEYVKEKLGLDSVADAICLAELIGEFTNRTYITSERITNDNNARV